MNIVYLLGIVLAFVFVIFGITFDPGGTGGLMVGPFNLDTLINFVDPASILIVLGGTLAVVVACYPKLAKSFPKHFKIMLRLDAFNPEQYVEELDYLDERHAQDRAFYDKASAYAPAFGMIGTLIGLINMLKNLSDSDMETLGPSMSVALITTFYGSLLAHVVFNPIASNLTARDEEEILCRQIIVEGIMAIQSGENPKFLRERLMTFMNQKLREGGESGGGTGEKKERKRRKEK